MATAVDLQNLTVEEHGPAVVITLNRPEKRNALSLALMQELCGVLNAIESRSDVRAVVLAGAGAAFSAGHDLSEMVGRDLPFYQRLFDTCTVLMETIHRLPQPVIAKVRGIATAAGCQLVAASDLAVAADTARFATPGVKIGLFCSTPMVPLSRAIGRKRALEMLLTGEPISADTAADWGLVNRVVPESELDQAVERLVELDSRVEPADGRDRQARVLRADRARRAPRIRPDESRDDDELDGGRRAGGDLRVPRQAAAGVDRVLALRSELAPERSRSGR